MVTSRRSMMVALSAGALLLRGGRAAAADGSAPSVGPVDPAAVLLRAAEATPGNCRAVAAVSSSVGRVRSLPVNPTLGRVILVNIAGAEVLALEDGREVLRSRVIVGSGRNRTPELASPVPSVRLNPPWYVPASIERELRASGASLDAFRRVGGRLIQPPGPRNPLGPIRIGLEESQGVFLHGTSDPGLFQRNARTLSHGCVRVERIFDLAAWVLDSTPEALRASIATGRTMELTPQREVRAMLAYLTAWPRADGRLVLHPDPYGFDRQAAQCRPPPVIRTAARTPT